MFIIYYCIDIFELLVLNKINKKQIEKKTLMIDLDRARFFETDKIEEQSFCKICVIDEKTFHRLLLLNQNNTVTLLLQQTLLYKPAYYHFPSVFAVVLEERISMIIHCFQSCIEKYGYNNVVFNV